jgi:Plasmid stabilisation system protein.
LSWYEEHEAGLGADFVKIVLESIDSLLINPLVHRLRDRRRNVRWTLTNRFPYKVVYKNRDQLVTVVAVLHTARHEKQSVAVVRLITASAVASTRSMNSSFHVWTEKVATYS